MVHMDKNYFIIKTDENYYCITHFLGAKGFITYGTEVDNGFLSSSRKKYENSCILWGRSKYKRKTS